ncbi:hypothetical protein ES706_02364 [subsurface metagenome]
MKRILLIVPLLVLFSVPLASAAYLASISIDEVPDYGIGDVTKITGKLSNTGDQTFDKWTYGVVYITPDPETEATDDWWGRYGFLEGWDPGVSGTWESSEVSMLYAGEYTVEAFVIRDANKDDQWTDDEIISNTATTTFNVMEVPGVPWDYIGYISFFAVGMPIGYVALRGKKS